MNFAKKLNKVMDICKNFTKLLRNEIFQVFIILIILSIAFYWYYFASEYISITQQGKFTVLSKCKAVSIFTFAPYVTVKVGDFEVLTTVVNPGYDTLNSCLISSVKQANIINDDKTLQILTEDNKIKEISIIYNPR